MADFEAILRKTLGGMASPSAEARAKVYERARAAIKRQIEGLPKRPSEAVVKRQYEKLDEAIALIEKEYAPPREKPSAAASFGAKPPKAAKPVEPEDPLAAFLAEQEADGELSVRPRPMPMDDDIRVDAGRGGERRTPESRQSKAAPKAATKTASGARKPLAGKRPPMWALAAAGVLVLAVIVGFGAWSFLGSSDSAVVRTDEDGLPLREVPSTKVTIDDTDNSGTTDAGTNGGTDELALTENDGPPKFTQRLTPEGTEVDEGPAQAPGATGEGTTVSGQTPGGAVASNDTGDSGTASDQTQPSGLPVGQRAIFYQERTGTQAGTAEAGATVWSVVQESPGGDAPPEPAIRAEATVPELGLTLEMTIRRNIDETFPASHVIELLFRVPEGFEGRGIADVQRITFKGTEQDPGNALIGVAAPLDTNIFLIALTDAQTAIETNLNLMRREQWIDIPMQYISGRRALITLEKGIPGEQVFSEVMAAWEQAKQAQN